MILLKLTREPQNWDIYSYSKLTGETDPSNEIEWQICTLLPNIDLTYLNFKLTCCQLKEPCSSTSTLLPMYNNQMITILLDTGASTSHIT